MIFVGGFCGFGGFPLLATVAVPKQLLIFGVFDEAANCFSHVDVENSSSDSRSRRNLESEFPSMGLKALCLLIFASCSRSF